MIEYTSQGEDAAFYSRSPAERDLIPKAMRSLEGLKWSRTRCASLNSLGQGTCEEAFARIPDRMRPELEETVGAGGGRTRRDRCGSGTGAGKSSACGLSGQEQRAGK